MATVHIYIYIQILILLGIDECTLNIQLVYAHATHSSYGKTLAYSGKFHYSAKFSGIANTTIHDKSRLEPVQTSIRHLHLEDEVTPVEVIIVTLLRIGNDHPALTLILKHVVLC